MSNNELILAASRIKRIYAGEPSELVYCDYDCAAKRELAWREDKTMLAEAYVATVREDDDEPITENNIGSLNMVYCDESGQWYIYCHAYIPLWTCDLETWNYGTHEIPKPENLGSLRRLISALKGGE